MEESNTNNSSSCKEKEKEKEGKKLLGNPTFEKLENGRFKCLETAHELPDHAKESYSGSKRCRIGLIDFYVAHKKPPLNMFKQCPLNTSKLICKLTGDTVNKSEEHIWKHINGKRFFNKLEQVEAGIKGDPKGKTEGSKHKEKKGKMKQQEEIVSEMRDVPADSDSEETDFWAPPMGERWDFDDGADRWASDSETDDLPCENDGADVEDQEDYNATSQLSKRTKRMSIEIGPTSSASCKKKSKTKSP